MKRNSGEIVIGLLVGLAVGAAMLWINSGNYAQELANSSGMDTSPAVYLTDKPGTSLLTVLTPAAGGAGLGWLLEEMAGDEDQKTEKVENQTTISVNGRDNEVVIRGDETTITKTGPQTIDNSVGAPAEVSP